MAIDRSNPNNKSSVDYKSLTIRQLLKLEAKNFSDLHRQAKKIHDVDVTLHGLYVFFDRHLPWFTISDFFGPLSDTEKNVIDKYGKETLDKSLSDLKGKVPEKMRKDNLLLLNELRKNPQQQANNELNLENFDIGGNIPLDFDTSGLNPAGLTTTPAFDKKTITSSATVIQNLMARFPSESTRSEFKLDFIKEITLEDLVDVYIQHKLVAFSDKFYNYIQDKYSSQYTNINRRYIGKILDIIYDPDVFSYYNKEKIRKYLSEKYTSISLESKLIDIKDEKKLEQLAMEKSLAQEKIKQFIMGKSLVQENFKQFTMNKSIETEELGQFTVGESIETEELEQFTVGESIETEELEQFTVGESIETEEIVNLSVDNFIARFADLEKTQNKRTLNDETEDERKSTKKQRVHLSNTRRK